MKLRSFFHLNQAAYFIVDYVLLWAATVWAYKFSPSYQNEILIGPWLNPELRMVGYGMPVFMALGLQLADLQRPRAGFRPTETFVRTFSAIAIGIVLFAAIHALITYSLVGRFVIFFTLLYGTAFVLGSRLVLWKLAYHSRRKVVLYGRPATFRVLNGFIGHFKLPIHLAGQTTLAQLADKSDRGQVDLDDRLLKFIRSHQADEIVVDVPESLTIDERRALSHCTRLGIPVADLSLFYERNFEQVYVEGLNEAWFWSYDPAHTQPWYFAFKRFSDIVLCLAGLVSSATFTPLVALAIKLQDGGPIFYSQLRLGRHNEPFKIYKFRTMRVDAEVGGAQWARPGDSRVTRLGLFLRRSRLDEVPQFWNILTGEMSFIGPRPERPEFVEKIEREMPFYSYRHLVKPGLTGWAQINYPYGASVEDTRRKLAYDLYYLKNASASMDLLIVFRTIVAMVKGAR